MESIQQSEKFTIRTYEIDSRKQATVPALVKLMHEAAMQNVIRIKLSVWDLEPHRVSWVLLRKMLRINRLPRLGETIRVVTQPTGFEKFFTYRDYRVFDESDMMIAWSSSTWLLMDTEKRTMARIPAFIRRYDQQMPDSQEHFQQPSSKLPTLKEPEFIRNYEVNWHDLDFNMHLNNTYYVQWMLEAAPDEILKNTRLTEFDIIYRTECMWKEKVRSEAAFSNEDTLLHRLVRISDNKELAHARSKWKE